MDFRDEDSGRRRLVGVEQMLHDVARQRDRMRRTPRWPFGLAAAFAAAALALGFAVVSRDSAITTLRARETAAHARIMFLDGEIETLQDRIARLAAELADARRADDPPPRPTKPTAKPTKSGKPTKPGKPGKPGKPNGPVDLDCADQAMCE